MSRASKLMIDFGDDLSRLPASGNDQYIAAYEGHRVKIFPAVLAPGYAPIIARFTRRQAEIGFDDKQWHTIHQRIERCTRGKPLPPISQKPSRAQSSQNSQPPLSPGKEHQEPSAEDSETKPSPSSSPKPE